MPKLFVGNLSFRSSEADVRALFERFGAVRTVLIPTHVDTGKSRGFGFVEMEDDDAAASAAQVLDGEAFAGRRLTVQPARQKAEVRPAAKTANRSPQQESSPK